MYEIVRDRDRSRTRRPLRPRPVNAVRAAELVTIRFPGAHVTEAELDEVGGGPIWEVKFQLGGGENEVNVDAVTGAIFGGDD
ncbi:PepSY domain-containing protein [Micromonospora deserti]|uniref:PepSY domain-containing protein n=1 Tax=Micromonospora deserti TaxID=2070366 RepID=UPI000DA76F45